MLRPVAVFLILICCTMTGIWKAKREGDRLRQLQMWQRIILLFAGAVSYKNIPLPDAFTEIGGKADEPYREFLLHVASEMKSAGEHSLSEIFADHIREDLQDTALTGEDKDEILELGADLGYLDKKMQLETLEACAARWAERTLEAKTVLPVRCRLYRSLGIMGGLFLSILLL